MTWSYGGDPSTSLKDSVRFIIGDTDSSLSLISDEEIAYALGRSSNNPQSAAIILVDALIAKSAFSVDYAIGPEKVDASKRFEHYTALKQLLLTSNGNAAPTIASTTDEGGIFDIGMHDNYGGDLRYGSTSS